MWQALTLITQHGESIDQPSPQFLGSNHRVDIAEFCCLIRVGKTLAVIGDQFGFSRFGVLGSGKLVATGGPDSTAGRHENRGGYGGSGRIAVRYTSSASGASSPGFHKSKHVEFSKTGTVVSKDLVAGKSAIGFYSFAYSLSGLPSGTGVKVQFSQNTSNWYSAAGKLNLANAMSAGGTKTLLLTMGWKKGPFYYRATLTGDASTTPKLSHVELNYVTK